MAKIKTKDFTAELSFCNGKACVKHQVHNPVVNTAELPNTTALLYAEVPSIFSNDCVNYKYKPFREEVKSTEVGHLFEHLMLEFIKLEEEENNKEVDIKGNTSWDWENEPFGTFNIEIEFVDNIDAIRNAFVKAGKFLEKLYTNKDI